MPPDKKARMFEQKKADMLMRRYGLTPEQFPHSQHAYERMLSLPLYTRMGPAEVQRVIDAVRALLTAEGAETWPRMSKDQVAMRLAAKIAEALNG